VRSGLRYRKICHVVSNVSKESDDSILRAEMDVLQTGAKLHSVTTQKKTT